MTENSSPPRPPGTNEGASDPTDLERTRQAIQLRRWSVVLLAPQSKRPPRGQGWPITDQPERAEAHVAGGGNLGLLCGEATGVAVLDPDKTHLWAEMVQELGEPGKPWVRTGSGRPHYYVALEPNLPAKLVWRGEVVGEIQRGPGQQQVVIPPSIHPDGGRYEWLVDPAIEPLRPLPGSWQAYVTGTSIERPRLLTKRTPSSRRHSSSLVPRGALRAP